MAGRRRERSAPDPDGRTGPEADPLSVARAIALRQLTLKARTRAELAATLSKRQVPQEAADEVLDRFEEVGLLDDADYAQRWVESRRVGRHLSKSRLGQELRRKGVGDEEVAQALAPVGHDDERAVALDLARRRIRGMAGLEPAVRYRRLAGILARRGFSGSVVASVLADVMGGGAEDDTGDGDVLVWDDTDPG